MNLSYKGYAELPKPTRYLFSMKFLLAFQAVLLSIVSLIFNEKLNISMSVTGKIMSAVTVTGAIGVYFGGFFASKFGEKLTIRVLLCSGAAAFFAAGFIKHLTFFSGMFLVAVFCMMATGPAMETLISTSVKSNLHKKVFSFTYLGTNVGYGIWSLIITRVYAKSLNVVSFLGTAVCVAMVFMLNCFAKAGTDGKSEELPEIDDARDGESGFSLAKKNSVILLAVIVFCIVYCQFGFSIPIRLNALWHEEGVSLFGVLGTVNALMVIIATPTVTALVEHKKEKDILAFAGLFYGVSFILLSLPMKEKYLFIIWVIIFTLGEIAYSVSLSAYIAAFNGEKERNKVFAISNACVLVGYVLGQNIAGIIPQNRADINFMAVSVLSFAAAFVCYRFLKTKRDETSEYLKQR